MRLNITNQPFCDSISVSQTHSKRHKPVLASFTINCHPDGTQIKDDPGYIKSIQLEGSYSTKIQIRSDGLTVKVKGNVGRFNRPDNVFGYNLDQIKIIINRILVRLGLPPFIDGEIIWRPFKSKSGEIIDQQTTTGATISEIHYTLNSQTGSKLNAQQFIDASSIKNINRQRVKIYRDQTDHLISGLTFGGGSRFKSSKIYIKSKDINHWLKKKNQTITPYHHALLLFCDCIGLLRYEVQFRNYLTRHSLSFWSQATHEKLTAHFYQEYSNMAKSSQQIDYDLIPYQLLGIYTMYLNGIDLRSKLPRATFYRKRIELLKFGIDISEVLNVKMLQIKQKVITLSPVTEMPEGYCLPNLDNFLQTIDDTIDEQIPDGYHWNQLQLIK